MDLQPLRLGIIGPGKLADHFLAPAIRRVSGLRLWSVLSRDRGRAREFAARHGARAPEPGHDSLDEFLADDELDAVLITTPDGLHAAQAVAAARAGKHVLTEKPMATSSAECRSMIDACERAGVRLGVAYHLRWHAGHRALARRVQAGALGELHHARIQWTFRAGDDTNWRARAEVARWWSLAAVGTHCLDLARWFMTPSCGEIVEARALCSNHVFKGPHDETAMIALRFASGATAELLNSVLFRAPRRIELHGERGYARCEGTLGPQGRGAIFIDEARLDYDPVDPYVGELRDFVAAVREGRAPEVSGAEGLRNVELLESLAP